VVLLLLWGLAGCIDKGVIHLVRMQIDVNSFAHMLFVSNNKRLFVLFSYVRS
jgi:hypothetical protein